MTVLLCLAVMCSLAGEAIGQQAASPERAYGEVIRGVGCVTAGVETGCIALRDNKTGGLYTLFFSDVAPAPHSAISFEGTAHQGMTTCMQGKGVDVTKWTPARGRCKSDKPSATPQ